MTCIAGLVSGGRVFIGADSAGSDAWHRLTIRKDAKAFRVGEFAIGFCGSFRMGQVLAHAFKPPPLPKKSAELERYMVVQFVDALRDTMKAKGVASKDDEKEELGSSFLVGVRGRLFQIESDYQVGEARDDFDAAGSGAEIARGALYALRGGKQAPARKLLIALRAAERGNSTVRGPFVFVSTEGKK